MSIHFYSDDGGYVGQSRRAASTAQDRADAECICAFAACEDLAALLDRHPGTSGDDPEAIGTLTARIHALVVEARALLGEKPTITRNAIVYAGPAR